MTPLNGLSLRQKLPLLASTLTVGALLVAGALAYHEVRQTAVSAAEARLTSLTEQLTTTFDEELRNDVELQEWVASSREVRDALTTLRVDTADLTLVLDSLRDGASGSLPVSVLGSDGSSVFTIGTMPRGPDPDPFPPLRETPAFGPFREVGDRVVYWESFPVLGPGGDRLGWIAQRQRVGNGTEIRDLFGGGISLRLGQLGDSVWIDLQGVRAEAAPESLVLGTPYTFSRADGEALGMGGRIPGTPWVVFLDMPMSQVLARPTAFLDRVVSFGGILVLCVVFLSWVASRRLTNPLEELADAADAVAGGDYRRRVGGAGSDELGRLATAFNTMAEQVGRAEAALHERLQQARELAVSLEEAHLSEAQARKEAQDANKAKADVMASISHEIRTPVSAVLAYTELLRNGVPDPPTPKQVEFLRRIDECGGMLVSLVDDVLDFSCIESGELRVEIGKGCTYDAVRVAVASIEPKARKAGVELANECVEGPAFLGDPQRVRQIVLNLLNNAVKFTPEGGRVTVRTRDGLEGPPGSAPDTRWVAIEVEDTGVGIARDQLERVFEPFKQGDAPPNASGSRKGVGLGLAISRHLATVMSGALTLESELGRGSCFRLWLPDGSSQRIGLSEHHRSWRRTKEPTARPA